MDLIVATFALNEEKTIGEMLQLIPKKINNIKNIHLLVVNDGSSDNTEKIAREHGASVINNVTQKRLAYSFQEAVSYAIDYGADILVTIDADLQFNPKDIPMMIAPIIEGNADFVAADRFSDPQTGKIRKPENMPITKYYSNRLGSKILGMLSGKKFADVTCGFRAYNKHALLSVNVNSRYTYTQESFQSFAINRLNIASIPVEVKYYKNRKSRVVTSFFTFLFGSALNILRAFRDFAPLKFFGFVGGIFLY